MMEKIVIFGAGKIGRSFIGQLFSRSGFEVVFIDVFEPVVSALNEKKEYKVIIKSNTEETLVVRNVKGVLFSNTISVINEITSARLLAISVGQQGLSEIIPTLAKGISERFSAYPKIPVDIILAENMRDAGSYLMAGLKKYLSKQFPFDSYIGLIETSIGKMVPIMSSEDIGNDILKVYAEPYNTLILDKKAFKNPIPKVDGLAPKSNIKAWVDRKLFIHNLGHACAAYAGFYYYPNLDYLYEVLDHEKIQEFVRQVMAQSAQILQALYPGEFSKSDLNNHIEDLIRRFGNKALKDTVFRVGKDLKRKLSANDRLLAPFHEGVRLGLPVDKIAEAILIGIHFRPTDQKGNLFEGDREFIEIVEKEGVVFVLKEHCGLTQKELELISHQFAKFGIKR